MKSALFFCLVLAFFLSLATSAAEKKDEFDPWMTEINVTGAHKIQVPKDMRIKRTEGRIILEDYNEYLARRLYEMEERIRNLEAALQELLLKIEELQRSSAEKSKKDAQSKISP